MSSLTTTWCPSSSQLRLAFNCRKSPTAFIRVRFQNLDYRRNGFRIYSVAETGNSATNSNENRNKLNDNVINEKEKEPQGNSWTNSSKLGDSFAGWSGSEQSDDDSKSKQSIGGIVGAGIAGVLLVAGLTFAALSISKKNTSRVKQEMEPLTTQQEISLVSDDHDEISGEEEEEKNKGVNDEQEISNEEKTGKDNDSFSYIDNDEGLETSLNDKTESGPTSNEEGDITSDEATNKQDLQNETAKDSTPGDDSFIASTTESKDDIDLVTENTESVFEQEKVDFVDDNVTKQETENSNVSSDSSPVEFITPNLSESSDLEPKTVREDEKEENISDSEQILDNSFEINNELDSKQEDVYSLVNEEEIDVYNDSYVSELSFDSTKPGNFFTCAGVPAPSLVSAALQANPGKILIPAIVDQAQGQALTALQVLKVIEANVQPGDLCTRREYARWLVSASSALSRSTISKVYPAMYIENITELAFDDITPQDPDFPSIQGLAEAGLISSKLSRRDMQSSSENEEIEEQNPLYFSPESALSRQDLVSWKMAIERRQLPLVNRTTMEQLCGFIDIDKIHPDAWPALVADLAAGEQGIIALALGYTRLFQPDKPVTKAQAAITLATGEASDIVNEELARIEAESVAEKAVSAHSELVAQVEKDINASYENELLFEREKINAVEKLAEETKKELERLKAEREEENLALMKERAAVDSEMEVFSKLRREVEEQLQIILSNQVEISYEKERVNKLRKDAEIENQEILRLQYELEVERKALSMARNWAEDEAKRAREQAKVLEEARVKWENQGIKVVVSDDLREEEENAVGTWVKAKQEEFSVEGTVERAETLMEKLKRMGESVTGKAKDTINMIIQKIVLLISDLKERVLKASEQAGEFKGAAFSKISGSLHEMGEYSYSAKEGIKRTVVDWKGGVEKFTQRFKT